MLTCLLVEQKKLFRSKIPLTTLLALTLVPLMAGFFMFILKDPLLAQRLGFISTKAQIMGEAHWAAYLSLLAQAVSVGGLLVFAFVASWIFGREYVEGTIKDLLALPVSRWSLVLAKFLVASLWCLGLAAYVLTLGLAVGWLAGLPGASPEVIVSGAVLFLKSAVLTILLSPPVALLSSVGRGYLLSLGFAVLTMMLAQIAAAIGYGEFFPWSVPALISGLAGSERAVLQPFSFFILLAASALGVLGTGLW